MTVMTRQMRPMGISTPDLDWRLRVLFSRVDHILENIQPHAVKAQMDTLGFEPRAFRMRSGCDTTTPCARLAVFALRLLLSVHVHVRPYTPILDGASARIPARTQKHTCTQATSVHSKEESIWP